MAFPSPEWRWLYAAELAAHLTEAARWKWSSPYPEAAHTAQVLARAVYGDRNPAVIVDLVEELERHLIEMFKGADRFLALLNERSDDPDAKATALAEQAYRAFIRLRYWLYEDGNELAA